MEQDYNNYKQNNKSNVKGVILYSEETQMKLIQHQKRLLLTQIDYWQRAARKSRMKRDRTNAVSHVMEVENTIVDIIKQKN